MLCLVYLLVSLVAFSTGLENAGIVHIRKLGFDQDPKTFSHEVIIPWARPFKPGYCESWEWHTDERYRERRTQICKKLGGQRKHECDSPSGFCRDKCPFTNGSYPYWRIRNAEPVSFVYLIKTLQFFDNANARKALSAEPSKGYASSRYAPGYSPSNAFDNNPESVWAPNGISSKGLNWIAYEFQNPVKINSIRIQGDSDHRDRIPSTFYVEASCEKYFKTYASQWTIENFDRVVDKRYNRPRQNSGRW